MPSFEVEFEVFCSCGEGLCNQSTGSNSKYGPTVTVEPCDKCLTGAEDDGYNRGYEEAQKEFDHE